MVERYVHVRFLLVFIKFFRYLVARVRLGIGARGAMIIVFQRHPAELFARETESAHERRFPGRARLQPGGGPN